MCFVQLKEVKKRGRHEYSFEVLQTREELVQQSETVARNCRGGESAQETDRQLLSWEDPMALESSVLEGRNQRYKIPKWTPSQTSPYCDFQANLIVSLSVQTVLLR